MTEYGPDWATYVVQKVYEGEALIEGNLPAAIRVSPVATPEVVEVLVGLMSHPSPRIRIRAIIDTDEFPHPEVIEGLVRLSKDPDPEVRAMVPRGFAFRPEPVRQ